VTAPAGSPGATYTARPGAAARPGRPYPLGATVTGGGTNFAVASEAAHGITLCLVGAAGDELCRTTTEVAYKERATRWVEVRRRPIVGEAPLFVSGK